MADYAECAGKKPVRPRLLLSAIIAGMLAAGVQFAGIGRVSASPKPDTLKLSVRPMAVRAVPISSFDAIDIGRRTFGKLEWIGGLRLISEDKLFGGWSGIALNADGKGFVAVSDSGSWMTGRIGYREGVPHGLEDVRVGPLKALDGSNLRRNRDRDAEAVTLVSGTAKRGQLLIAFEQNHRIGRFQIGPNGVSAPTSYIRPDTSRGRMPSLKGFEAIAVLRAGKFKGALVAIGERMHDEKGRHTGWLWTGGKARAFALTDIGGFDITDAVSLPDGDLLVLERRFRWTEGVKMRIRRIASGELAPGAAIEGEVLLEATMAQVIDNMEGIGVYRDARGDTIITVISDDNFNRGLQKTVLIQFRLPDTAVKSTAR